MPNTDDYIGVVIADVARLLRTAFDRRVRTLGITRAQWLVLTRLHRRPSPDTCRRCIWTRAR